MEEAVVEEKEVPDEEVEEEEEEGWRERRPPCGWGMGRGREGREGGWLGDGGETWLLDFELGRKGTLAVCWVPTYRRTEGGRGLVAVARPPKRKDQTTTPHRERGTPLPPQTQAHTFSRRPHHALHTYLGLGLLVKVGSQGGARDATAGHAHALSLVETAGGERLQGAPAPAQRHRGSGLLVVG